MTGQQLPLGDASSVFAAHEPVLQSLPLLEGATSPTFGEADRWDFNGVLRRPASRLPGQWRLPFAGLSPVQGLLARELAMIEFNPRHPSVLAAGLHLPPTPRKVPTHRGRGQVLRALASFGTAHHLPDDFALWEAADFHDYLVARRREIDDTALRPHVTVIKLLHQFAPALSRGLAADPGRARPQRRSSTWSGTRRCGPRLSSPTPGSRSSARPGPTSTSSAPTSCAPAPAGRACRHPGADWTPPVSASASTSGSPTPPTGSPSGLSATRHAPRTPPSP